MPPCTEKNNRPLLALLGGSFNPPHVGHLRIALEVRERLRPERLLFIPCARPLHKPSSLLLPFSLRASMLEAALSPFPDMEVSRVEEERPGPSYTVDTLAELTARYPRHRLVFIMGGEDFAHLSTWNRWRLLPKLADLLVLPRSRNGTEFFLQAASELWPTASPAPEGLTPEGLALEVPEGGKLLYLPQPWLEISSSLVRRRWLQKRALDFLAPPAVITLLENNRPLATAIWSQTGPERQENAPTEDLS